MYEGESAMVYEVFDNITIKQCVLKDVLQYNFNNRIPFDQIPNLKFKSRLFKDECLNTVSSIMTYKQKYELCECCTCAAGACSTTCIPHLKNDEYHFAAYDVMKQVMNEFKRLSEHNYHAYIEEYCIKF